MILQIFAVLRRRIYYFLLTTPPDFALTDDAVGKVDALALSAFFSLAAVISVSAAAALVVSSPSPPRTLVQRVMEINVTPTLTKLVDPSVINFIFVALI
jgi:hypothetical protein